METKEHTPGPWVKLQYRGRTEKIISADNNDWCICTMPNWIGDHEEKEANSTLIVTAPDLLKVTEETLQRLTNLSIDIDFEGPLEEELAGIRIELHDVIEKARGRA